MLNGAVRDRDSILTGWKQIAGYLERTPRTAQRWAREAHMPIRHLLGRRRSPVIAIKHEIDDWVRSRDLGNANHTPAVQSPARSDLRTSLLLHQQLVQKMTQARRSLSSTRAILKQTISKIRKNKSA